MSYLSWLFVTAYFIYSLVEFVLCARQLSGAFTEETPSPIWTSPHVKADVLMMGIAESDQITNGNWDA